MNQSNSRFPFAVVASNPATTTYNITFTVTDSNSDPIVGAKIVCGGMNGVTDSSGVAIFKSQANQTYAYSVYNTSGKLVTRDEVSVVNSNANVSVTI